MARLELSGLQSETDANLKIRVLNVSKNELYRNLRLYPDARWDQSPLFSRSMSMNSVSSVASRSDAWLETIISATFPPTFSCCAT